MTTQAGADSFDDDFDDDIFDNLPNSTIQALENRIPIASQYASRSVQAEPLRPALSILHQASGPRRQGSSNSINRPGPGPEEEVINLDDYPDDRRASYNKLSADASNASTQWKRTHSSGAPVQVPHRPVTFAPSSTQALHPHGSQASQASLGHRELASLQAKIQQLEKHNADLKRSADSSEAKFQAKAGEASILRQRIDQATREYELKLDSLKQAHLDSAAKQRAELHVVQKEKEKVETDRRFLEHDLALESSRAGQPQSKLPAITRSRTIPEDLRKSAFSPKKPRQFSFGDGFDDAFAPPPSPSRNRSEPSNSVTVVHGHDYDIQLPASPAKSWTGSKPVTPNKRPEKKRKRGEPTPIGQRTLDMKERPPGSTPMLQLTPDPFFDAQAGGLDLRSIKQRGSDFVESIFDYKISHSDNRFFDIMGRHSLPSMPSVGLAAWILDRWSINKRTGDDLVLHFCTTVCHLWQKCLQEKHYDPVNSLVDVLHFVISKTGSQLSRKVVSNALPPTMKSINAVAFPIASERDDETESKVVDNIDSKACLEFLLSIARDCQHSKDAVTSFWSTMNLHWTLVLLYPSQPYYHINLMCHLLRTSSLDNSFGPIFQSTEFDSVNDQDDLEQILIDRLTSLLSVHPQAADSHEKLGIMDILSFRLELVETLFCFAIPPRTGISIARHPKAIGRLIQFLHTSLNLLYSTSSTPLEPHNLTVSCINTGMRLLYAVLTNHADTIDIREKLKAVEGGAHSHLIVLTRIAFCESIVLERGIEPAVSDAAHMLLDEYLSPVEGEQLLKMFPSSEGPALGGESRSPEYEAVATEVEEAPVAAQQKPADAMDLS